MKQRELMRTLYRKCGDDESALMPGKRKRETETGQPMNFRKRETGNGSADEFSLLSKIEPDDGFGRIIP